ncbi:MULTISPECIES: uracil-DNA glycosylase [unclassified Sphingomonas]|uniref:uracil-DNA glycosylase n=1 Tax=unclassified Sphingomonas TaxID=196159 RepID=UPI0006FBDB66|nr:MULTISPECIES: uracil-DNA glycosylase [unclassified Sphingomonas]KQN27197.1 uracil-DNA glycosylase [Sphingomonas sp. Leaf34]KQN31015.1 uracil-DNA glycosylase [Sphingomonas sp. Leaf38]
MGADQTIDWRNAAASALDWWHEAGVDTLVDDVPRDWFAAPEPLVVPAAAPAGPVVAQSAMPLLLADFLDWRRGAAVPEADWSGVSLAAMGPADATVMVLVDCPDRDDGDAGALLSGASGRLLDRMLAAIGLTRDDVHLAAVCAKRPTAGRIHSDVEERLAEIAKHHIGLVAPQRLLLLGNAASRAILGTELQAARGRLHDFNHKTGETGAGSTAVVASFHPRFLIEKPAAKAEAWKDLQMLMGAQMSQKGAR